MQQLTCSGGSALY